MQTATQKPGRAMREGEWLAATCHYPLRNTYESVYQTLFLGLLKPGKLQNTVKNETTVDALWICISCRSLRESVG